LLLSVVDGLKDAVLPHRKGRERMSETTKIPCGRDVRTSWNAVADWYNGWVGPEGSEYHRRLAIPAVMELLAPRAREMILDVGAGQGVLAPHIVRAGAVYTGVDASLRLLRYARKHHGRIGRFLLGDARRLAEIPALRSGSFDAVVFLLSIQNMEPLPEVFRSAAWALRPGGRLVLLMTHPCFQVPMQSGWEWDRNRKLLYRRVDRYLTALQVPLTVTVKERDHRTLNFHRPLEEYVNRLTACGLLVERLKEIPLDSRMREILRAQEERPLNRDIPLFLGLSARKMKNV
jgi:SAM-dependent methyltransferase